MVSKLFANTYQFLWLCCLLSISIAHAENVGPADRDYRYFFFDATINDGGEVSKIVSDNSWLSTSISPTDSAWKTISNPEGWKSAVTVSNPYTSPNNFLVGTNAQLIWAPTNESSDSSKAYFTKTFDVGATDNITATATLLADDFFAISVNGHFVTNAYLDNQIPTGSPPYTNGEPVVVDFSKWLEPNRQNTISIFAYDGYKAGIRDLINKDSVSTITDEENTKMRAYFTPSDALGDITITDAADILGYDHFNWYQLGGTWSGSYSESDGTWTGYFQYTGIADCPSSDPNYPPATPCADPPIGSHRAIPWLTGNADGKPFYWDETNDVTINNTADNTYFEHIDPTNNTLDFYDKPTGGSLKPWRFDTFLVGIIDKSINEALEETWDPLYYFSWASLYNYKDSSSRSINYCNDCDGSIMTSNAIVIACMIGNNANANQEPYYLNGSTSLDCLKDARVSEPPVWFLFLLGFITLNIFIQKNKKYSINF